MKEEIFMPLRNALDERREKLELFELFGCLSEVCARAGRPVVLLIDEADTATNNQVFLDFLAQLRAAYLDSDVTPTFQSVILVGVYDVCNIRKRIQPEAEHRQNSPWNIAADFDIEMDFSASDIAGMLNQYEEDYRTGMNIDEIAGLLYDYTSGYPFLVSRLCKLMDEKLVKKGTFKRKSEVWTERGVCAAVGELLSEKNSLFDSLNGQLNDYPEMKARIHMLLSQGQAIAYNADDSVTDLLHMFGFIKEEQGTVQIANRIFETRLKAV